ncbi:hypothetical protein ACP70R_020588 [Stipagrostis hirtigluma subsp. patula]
MEARRASTPPPAAAKQRPSKKKAKKDSRRRSSIADRFAALPPEVHDRIVALLPFWDVIQLYGVCRAWRRLRLHRKATVVNIDLRDLVMVDGCTLYDPDIYGLRVALGDKRTRPVETLSLAYWAGHRDMREHADTLMEKVQPHKIRISLSLNRGAGVLDAFFRRLERWTMFVPFLANEFEIEGGGHRVPVIDDSTAPAPSYSRCSPSPTRSSTTRRASAPCARSRSAASPSPCRSRRDSGARSWSACASRAAASSTAR